MTTDLKLGPIGQISRQVSDVAKAIEWYRDVLGLTLIFTAPSAVGDLAFFDCGGTRLFLVKPESVNAGSDSVLYFRVDDIQSAHQQLVSKGVTFVEEPHIIFRHESGLEEWMAFFRDFDNKMLALMSQVTTTPPVQL